MLPSRNGASVAKPPLPFRSPSVICGVRPRSSFSFENSALRSRMVIILPSTSDGLEQVARVPYDLGGSLLEPQGVLTVVGGESATRGHGASDVAAPLRSVRAHVVRQRLAHHECDSLGAATTSAGGGRSSDRG